MSARKPSVIGVALFVAIAVIGLACGSEADDPLPDFAPGDAVAIPDSPAASLPFQEKLTANDASFEDGLGWAVALDGDTLVVGALFDNGLMGAVYIYEPGENGWGQSAKITADDGAGGDEFGASVSIDGDTIVIGAPFDEGFAGSAYVFVRTDSGWTQQAKLLADEQTGFDEYASYVAIKGDTIVIGNPLDDDGANASGAVHIYERSGNTWSHTAKLIADDAQPDDNFGRAVAFDGESVLVGTPNDDDAGLGAGAAYVFVRNGNGWTQQAKLIAQDAKAGDDFGRNVSIHGDTAVVASPWHDDFGANSGAAYVFVRVGNSWTQQAELTAGDPAERENFGRTVFVENDAAVVGATRDEERGFQAGAAYLFAREGTTWTQKAKLIGADTARGDEFGRGVAINQGRVLVGAPFDDDACPTDRFCESGSVHVFEIGDLLGR